MKRVWSATVVATLWMAGAAGGIAADAPAVGKAGSPASGAQTEPGRAETPAPGVELRQAPGVGFSVDCNSPAHWDGDTLYVFTSGPANKHRFSGHDLSSLTNKTQCNGSGGWVEATWTDTNGLLYAWYHNEDVKVPVVGRGNRVIPRIGAQVSTDNGATWKQLGVILEAPRDSINSSTANRFFCGGNGDFSVMLDAKQAYLYLFISTYHSNVVEQGVSVARMKWTDRDQPVGKVWKWHKGAWNEPGIGGHVTPVFAVARDWHMTPPDAFWGPSIHWNTYLETYVIILNRAVTTGWGNEGHYITFNRDLSNPGGWTAPRKISDKGGWYGQVIGTEQGKGTDKLAGQVARFFVSGKSDREIVFTRPGEK